MIPENIRTRLFTDGVLRRQLSKLKQIAKENPESLYANSVYKALKKKFWYGSRRVYYHDIFNEAWSKLLSDKVSEIIEIGALKFVNDEAFMAEYTDIFLAGGVIDELHLTKEQKIACQILSILSVEGSYEDKYVKVKKDDIVIDAGANMGLFSMFCKNKEVAKVYAFEPQQSVISILEKNIRLNHAAGLIEIVPLGVSDNTAEYNLSHSNSGTSAASIVIERNTNNDTEVIRCVDLDSWVRENNISRIDFIKADIEGAERKMLVGTTGILRDFAPRLAICTYHLPDDPVVLENIIIKANPDYVIKHTSHKLFAYVPQKKAL